MLTFRHEDTYNRQKYAVLDLDGCLVQNPEEARYATLNDPSFWHSHWNDALAGRPNEELLDVARGLLDQGYRLIVLTARPETYRSQTVRYLGRICLFTTLSPRPNPDQSVSLVMRPVEDGISRSGPWKRDLIKSWLDQGANITLALEDFKPNADMIRQVVPVILYEQMKSHDDVENWQRVYGRRAQVKEIPNTIVGIDFARGLDESVIAGMRDGRIVFEQKVPCCERDTNRDGDCPRHPRGILNAPV